MVETSQGGDTQDGGLKFLVATEAHTQAARRAEGEWGGAGAAAVGGEDRKDSLGDRQFHQNASTGKTQKKVAAFWYRFLGGEKASEGCGRLL